MTIGAIVTIIATLAIAVLMAIAGRAEYDRRKRRASFGPEYELVRREHGRGRAADRELARRAGSHGRLRLNSLTAGDVEFYEESWSHIQGGFVDDPEVAVRGAEQLTVKLLAACGYPVEDANELSALLSVRYGSAVGDYRKAREVSGRLRADSATVSVDEMRGALLQYRVLCADVLTECGAVEAAAGGRA